MEDFAVSLLGSTVSQREVLTVFSIYKLEHILSLIDLDC